MYMGDYAFMLCERNTKICIILFGSHKTPHQKQEILGDQGVIPKLVWWLCGGVIFLSKAPTNLETVKGYF